MLWVRLPPNAPDDVLSTGVRRSPISSGELPDQRRRHGSTPWRTTILSRPMECGTRPPKACCAGSTPAREARYADQAEIAQQVLGKDERQGAIPWFGSNMPSTPRQRGAELVPRRGARKSLGGLHSLQVQTAGRRTRNAEGAVQIGRGEPISGRKLCKRSTGLLPRKTEGSTRAAYHFGE